MTALVFALEENRVCVAMDTLVVGADDRLPLSFQRKFLPLPAHNLLVAGTGHAGLVDGFFRHVQSITLPGDVDWLSRNAENTLDLSVRAAGGLDGLTATIYLFGYSTAEQRYVGYAHRSESCFSQERLSYGLGMRPPVQISIPDDLRFPDFMVQIALLQQQLDNSCPLSERLGIGGELEFAVLALGTVIVQTIYQFPSHSHEASQIANRGVA